MNIFTSNRPIPIPILLLLSCIAGFFVFFPVTDADIFWHLASGRELFHQKAFLFQDPFSYTSASNHWINLHWMFQILHYTLWQIGGIPLLLAGKWCIFSAATLLLLSAFKLPVKSLPFLILLLPVIFGQRYLVPLRPGLATLFFIALSFFSCERFLTTRHRRWLAVFIGIQIAWVNSQGLFLLGPVIGAAYTVEGRFEQVLAKRFSGIFHHDKSGTQRHLPFWVVPAQLCASLVNPYGPGALSFAAKLFLRITPSAQNIYSSMITENMPLLSMTDTMYSPYVAIAGLLFFLVTVSAVLSRHTLRISLLLLAAAGFFLAFMAQRNGILFTFLAFPSLLYHSAKLPDPHTRTAQLGWFFLLSVAVVATVYSFISHSAVLRIWPHTVSPFSHPVHSARYIRSHPFTGNIFNADRYGGYLIWELYPDYKVFCDTRLTLRSDGFFKEYLMLVENPALFESLADKWQITCAVIPVAPIELYMPLAAYLYNNPAWNLVYTDGAEALFFRHTTHSRNLLLDNPEVIDTLIQSLTTEYHATKPVLTEACHYLTRFCISVDALQGARRIVEPRTDLTSRLLLASVYEKQGNNTRAEAILTSEIARHPRNNHLAMHLIYFYLAHGQEEKALNALSRLLRKNPFHPPARSLLSTLKQGIQKK